MLKEKPKPTVEDFYSKEFTICEQKLLVEFVDTAGGDQVGSRDCLYNSAVQHFK